MPIIASGSRASTLHYICNHAPFVHGALPTTLDSSAFQATAPAAAHGHEHDGPDPLALGAKGDWQPQVLLIDAGTETDCYGADITRTMPVGNGGRFTPEARDIYALVLHMQKEAEKMTRAGVHWDTIQLATHRLLVRGLLELGIFRGGDEETILRSGISTGFFPHGLGHSIGLDVHDVPSASKPNEATNETIPDESRQTPELYAFLRLRLPLASGMLITIEPGCYFSPHLLKRWRGSEFIDPAVLGRYEPVGGVRIEDVVLVERDGCRNLTSAVREVADVERLCSGA
jgi:Xaa-Pro dipeptidase